MIWSLSGEILLGERGEPQPHVRRPLVERAQTVVVIVVAGRFRDR